MEESGRPKSWKSPQFLVTLATIAAIISAIFQITGPVPRSWLQAIPAFLGSIIVGLTGFLSRFGIYIAIPILIWLGYRRRRDVIQAVRLIKEWLYVRPFAYFLGPVVKRIVGVPVSDTVVAGRPGWKVVGNWEIQEKETTNWELGPDSIRGKDSGTALWKAPLPKACRIGFEARITEVKGGNEIDVIVGDVMMLFYGEGVRLDLMTEDLKREPGKKTVGIPGPQLGKWYRYTVEVTQKNKCVVILDGTRVVEFDCNLGRTWFTGRFGFAHWKNSIEVRNLRIETGGPP